MTGMIKKVAMDRGFGFIQAEDGKDYFFHQSELGGSVTFAGLKEGQHVTFEPQPSDKGPRAIELKLAS